ncbi:MAG: hypothetical protein NVSMB46_01640 [Candidatus Saccharimonadales bacterium]
MSLVMCYYIFNMKDVVFPPNPGQRITPLEKGMTVTYFYKGHTGGQGLEYKVSLPGIMGNLSGPEIIIDVPEQIVEDVRQKIGEDWLVTRRIGSLAIVRNDLQRDDETLVSSLTSYFEDLAQFADIE